MTASEANQDMSSDLNASQGRMQGRTGQDWAGLATNNPNLCDIYLLLF